MTRTIVAILAWLLVSCGAARPALLQPADATLSLVEIDCQSCGANAIELLQAQPGVESAQFDREKAQIAVHFDQARVLPGDLVHVLKSANLQAKVGAGQGSYVAQLVFPAGADVRWISHGEAVDVAAAAVAGKVTVVDFGARWCGPCREIDKTMSELLPNQADVALRKVDIGNWDTPVAKQYLANVEALPYILVFGVDGKQVAAVSGLHPDQLLAAIAKGKKP
jgi:thioredoxin 1